MIAAVCQSWRLRIAGLTSSTRSSSRGTAVEKKSASRQQTALFELLVGMAGGAEETLCGHQVSRNLGLAHLKHAGRHVVPGKRNRHVGNPLESMERSPALGNGREVRSDDHHRSKRDIARGSHAITSASPPHGVSGVSKLTKTTVRGSLGGCFRVRGLTAVLASASRITALIVRQPAAWNQKQRPEARPEILGEARIAMASARQARQRAARQRSPGALSADRGA